MIAPRRRDNDKDQEKDKPKPRPRPPKPPKPSPPTSPPVSPPPVTSPPTVPPATSPPPPPPVSPDTGFVMGSWGDTDIDQWDRVIIAASEAVARKRGVTVPPRFLKSVMDVETGGDGNYPPTRCRPCDGHDCNPACGPFQIKASNHQWRCPECDLNTVAGGAEMAAHIIGMTMQERRMDPYDAFFAVYFPTDDINGTTQKQYRTHINNRVATMERDAATGGGTTPAPQGNVLDLLFGGRPYIVTADYGQLVTWSCPGCYDYFPAYGLDSAHHYAIDVEATAGDGAPLFAPFSGTVVCAGTGVGRGAWDTGCAAFPRTNNYNGAPSGVGSGRLELLHADGTKSLILGHALSSRVRLGDIVQTGDLIGAQGGMNGSHVHVEGRYANGTRIGNPYTLFGGGPMPERYADTVIVAQPDDEPPYLVMRAIRPTAVRQRANPAAPKVFPDLAVGTEFFAQHQVLGTDGNWWYIGRLGGRVLASDAEIVRTVLE